MSAPRCPGLRFTKQQLAVLLAGLIKHRQYLQEAGRTVWVVTEGKQGGYKWENYIQGIRNLEERLRIPLEKLAQCDSKKSASTP